MKLEFEELYSQIEQNQKETFTEISKKMKEESNRNIMISLIICIIIDLIMIFKFWNTMNKFMIFFPIIIIDIVIFALIFAVFSKNQREYNRLFKENVISALINNFYDDLYFSPKSNMPRSIYDEARYDEYYNRYNSEDYFRGKIENRYDIQMAEVKTEKEETHRDSDGKTRTERYLKFHGLFAKIKMEKSLQTSLQIRGNFKTSESRVKMDSQEFEKYFDVASDNKIITMQILTHDVMEMLISFLQDTNLKFDISIYGTDMYFRFFTGEMFEAVSFKDGNFDKEKLKKYYDVIEFKYVLSRKIIELIEQAKI